MSHSSHGHKQSSSSTVITSDLLASFVPTKLFDYHQQTSITSLDFHDSGQYLISSGVDKSIQLYDVHKGVHHKDIQSQKYGAHLAKFTHQELNCLYASTPNATLDVDHSIRYLALSSNTYLRYFKGHKEQVTSVEMNPVSDTFISSSLDRTVKVWDLKSPSAVGNLDIGQPSVIAFDPSGIIFAVGKYPDPSLKLKVGQLLLYDLSHFDKAPFLTVDVPVLSGQIWNKLEFSNNGKFIMISTDSHESYILDAFLGQLLTTLIVDVTRSNKEYGGDWMSFKYPYTGSSCFTPCGRFVTTGTPKAKLCLFNLGSIKNTEGGSQSIREFDNPKRLLPFKTLDSKMATATPKIVAFNPKLLTIATADNTVTLWNPATPDTI